MTDDIIPALIRLSAQQQERIQRLEAENRRLKQDRDAALEVLGYPSGFITRMQRETFALGLGIPTGAELSPGPFEDMRCAGSKYLAVFRRLKGD